jgi:hypothetical protein
VDERRGQDKGEKRLTKREIELQFLAREIIREAGVQREEAADVAEYNRVIDTLRDQWKILYDLSKEISVLSLGLLAGLVALLGVFYPNPVFSWIVYVAALVLVVAVVGALLGMMQASTVLVHLYGAEQDAVTRGQKPKYPLVSDELASSINRFKGWRWVPVTALGVGAMALLLFAFLNLTPATNAPTPNKPGAPVSRAGWGVIEPDASLAHESLFRKTSGRRFSMP